MKVLVVGSGAREHALVKLVMRSPSEPRVCVIHDYRNPGLERDAERSGGRAYVTPTTDPLTVVRIAETESPDLVVVGPEEPLFAGVSDALRERGFTVFGASSKCAEIERSKAFARALMWKHGIPGRLHYRAFKDLKEAKRFVELLGDVVVKPARQFGGRGVKAFSGWPAVQGTGGRVVGAAYVEKLYGEMERYKDVEYKVLVEQRVEGVEYTVHVITDGSYALPLPLIQDHPHAFDYDLGPKTGGMGSIMGPGFLLPFITPDEYAKSVEIVKQALEALKFETRERCGGAFAGQMMLTGLWGPTVIEFYSRFGDPEVSNLVPVVESDFLELLDRAATGRLAGAKLEVSEGEVTVVKAVAPVGYPDNKAAASNHPVTVDEGAIRELGCDLLYASVEVRADGLLYTKGSRAFEVVCGGHTYSEAHERCERALQFIRCLDGWQLFYRRDIGSPELIKERFKVAERVRRVYTSRAARGLLGHTPYWTFVEGLLSKF